MATGEKTLFNEDLTSKSIELTRFTVTILAVGMIEDLANKNVV